jgi:hypothetical protein
MGLRSRTKPPIFEEPTLRIPFGAAERRLEIRCPRYCTARAAGVSVSRQEFIESGERVGPCGSPRFGSSATMLDEAQGPADRPD